MDTFHRHDWSLTPAEAIALQKDLARQVISTQPIPLDSIQTVAGVDVSVRDEQSRAAVVVLRFPTLEVLEIVCAEQPTPFPYIPGLLTFREGPVLVEAFRRLRHTPDAFIFDGMGIAHPRQIGIASHLGLWLDKPTVGCGKTHLIGAYEDPGLEKGCWSPLKDHGQTIGAVLRTRDRTKPVYISPGHLADLSTALELTLRCTPRFRLPEPIRQAHHAAGQAHDSAS